MMIYSYLIEIKNSIKNSVNDSPYWNELGSQLIAKTFGAKVYKGPTKEIGFYHDLMFSNDSKLFGGFKNPFTVFHWHGDTFDLPTGATRLALSENYPNQAFQYKSAIGLQFHLEVNEQMVNLCLDNTEEKCTTNGIYQSARNSIRYYENISL